MTPVVLLVATFDPGFIAPGTVDEPDHYGGYYDAEYTRKQFMGPRHVDLP